MADTKHHRDSKSFLHRLKTHTSRRLMRLREEPESPYRGPTVPDEELANACLRRGHALFTAKKYNEALDEFDRALALKPAMAVAYSNRGAALHCLGKYELAIESLDRALMLDEKRPDAYRNKAAVLSTLGHFSEAMALNDRALSLNSSDHLAYINRGTNLLMMNKPQEAIAAFDKALALAPDDIDAHWGKSNAMLLNGDFAQGLPLYEWRTRKWHVNIDEIYTKAAWLGDAPIEGKTILIFPEQGHGDFIQFCRYVRNVEACGGKVIVEARKPLVELARTLSKTAIVIEQGQPRPDYDLVCSVASLPFAFGTTLGTIPADIPYLHADAAKRQQWCARLGERSGVRVGIVWSGGFRPEQPELWSTNERRNIPLQNLAQLNLPGIEFFSLQVGDDAIRQLKDLRQSSWEGPAIIDLTADITDFSDTAALIDNLDLVISVDTSTAHLAGALGKPVWILNRFDTCWRWMLNRTDSPWYPTARLFRQPAPGDWDSVVTQVRAALQEFVHASEHLFVRTMAAT